ncbi:MAG: PIN domain-containing protein [Chloroflexi bacterium]|nr:PIN domain-containing protein [Chloroflexota bacterium]
MRLFADTGAWCALYDRSDVHHARASAFLHELNKQKAQLITSDYVLDETLTLLRFRAGHKEAIEFGKWVLQSPLVKVINVGEKIWQAAWEMFARYDDKNFSFTDCTSFALMRQLGLINAFAFDHNFEQAGFVMLPSEG